MFGQFVLTTFLLVRLYAMSPHIIWILLQDLRANSFWNDWKIFSTTRYFCDIIFEQYIFSNIFHVADVCVCQLVILSITFFCSENQYNMVSNMLDYLSKTMLTKCVYECSYFGLFEDDSIIYWGMESRLIRSLTRTLFHHSYHSCVTLICYVPSLHT